MEWILRGLSRARYELQLGRARKGASEEMPAARPDDGSRVTVPDLRPAVKVLVSSVSFLQVVV